MAQVTATLTFLTVNMMLYDDRCFVCGKTGHIGCHCPNAQWYNCKNFSHFAHDWPDKILPSETHVTMTGCTPNHVMTTTVGTDPNPLNTDISKENALTGQDHITDPTAAEAPATIGGMHPTLHPTTAAAHHTHQLML